MPCTKPILVVIFCFTICYQTLAQNDAYYHKETGLSFPKKLGNFSHSSTYKLPEQYKGGKAVQYKKASRVQTLEDVR